MFKKREENWRNSEIFEQMLVEIRTNNISFSSGVSQMVFDVEAAGLKNSHD